MIPSSIENQARILVAEDDGNLRAVYAEQLRRAGYDTISAATAGQCLAAVQRRRPDVVVVDLAVALDPAGDLLGQIRRADQWLPVLVNLAGAPRAARQARLGLAPHVFWVSALPQMLRLIRWLTSADAPSRRLRAAPRACSAS